MRAADLAAPDRRLLRHAGRVDPNPTITTPAEWEAAERLRKDGLLERVGPTSSPKYRITPAGRQALR